MKNKKQQNKQTMGTPATLYGQKANSPEFIPGDLNDPKNDFTTTLNDVYDVIPEIKADKFH